MGLTESNILIQAKKAQGETNVRLERLLAEQQRTNYLLGELLRFMTQQPPAR